MRLELKVPLGVLLRGEPSETVTELKKIIESKPPFFACVGDFVSKNILDAGLVPDLIIVDNKIMRASIPSIKHGRVEVKIHNEPASISDEALKALKNAVTLKRRIAVVVEGEEDLLVLPLLAETPLGSVIAYGQPNEGLVVVTVTDEKRAWARGFMKKMERKNL